MTIKESAGVEHQTLVKALIDKFVNDGLVIVKAAYEGYDEPYKIERHKPDIIAKDSNTDIIFIGEAKLCDDLASDRTKEQFEDFSSRVMTEGRCKGAPVPFHIVVPKNCPDDVVLVLAKLRLGDKSNIKVWKRG